MRFASSRSNVLHLAWFTNTGRFGTNGLALLRETGTADIAKSFVRVPNATSDGFSAVHESVELHPSAPVRDHPLLHPLDISIPAPVLSFGPLSPGGFPIRAAKDPTGGLLIGSAGSSTFLSKVNQAVWNAIVDHEVDIGEIHPQAKSASSHNRLDVALKPPIEQLPTIG